MDGRPSGGDVAIAVIGGTGHQGFGLAVRWGAAGLAVAIGSRSPQRAEAAAARAREIVGRVRGTPPPVVGYDNIEAARLAPVVVVTVPAGAHAATLEALAPAVGGKVLVDCTVPLDRNPAYAVQLPEGSAAQAAQRILGPGTPVVGAFHTVPASLLQDLARPVDCDVLVCGDDREAKARVVELARAIGARAVDVGTLRQAHTLERLTALLIGVGRRTGRHELGVRITGL
jgi:NADPH-dependent F420 reductase